MLQHSLPVGGVLELAEIGAHVASQNSQGGRLADTVLTDETEHLAGTRCGQSVQLERVRAVSVRGLALETLGQIDDSNRIVGADLDAKTATNAECFRN